MITTYAKNHVGAGLVQNMQISNIFVFLVFSNVFVFLYFYIVFVFLYF